MTAPRRIRRLSTCPSSSLRERPRHPAAPLFLPPRTVASSRPRGPGALHSPGRRVTRAVDERDGGDGVDDGRDGRLGGGAQRVPDMPRDVRGRVQQHAVRTHLLLLVHHAAPRARARVPVLRAAPDRGVALPQHRPRQAAARVVQERRALERRPHRRGRALSRLPRASRDFGVGPDALRGRASELAEAATSLPLHELGPLLRVVSDTHKKLVMDDRQVSMNVLRDFLALSHRRKNEAVDAIEREMASVDADLAWVEARVAELGGSDALDAFDQEIAAALDPANPRAARGRAPSSAGTPADAARAADAATRGGANSRNKTRAAAAVCQMLSAWGINGDERGRQSALAAPRTKKKKKKKEKKPPRLGTSRLEPRGEEQRVLPSRRVARVLGGVEAELDGHDARRGAEQAERERAAEPRDARSARVGVLEQVRGGGRGGPRGGGPRGGPRRRCVPASFFPRRRRKKRRLGRRRGCRSGARGVRRRARRRNDAEE